MLPAWDPPEGISFSNEILWLIIFVLLLGILYFSENYIGNGNPWGSRAGNISRSCSPKYGDHRLITNCTQIPRHNTPNPPTNIVDFGGFDSSVVLILRGGILMSIGDFPEVLSQAMLVGCNVSREIGRMACFCGVRPAKYYRCHRVPIMCYVLFPVVLCLFVCIVCLLYVVCLLPHLLRIVMFVPPPLRVPRMSRRPSFCPLARGFPWVLGSPQEYIYIYIYTYIHTYI